MTSRVHYHRGVADGQQQVARKTGDGDAQREATATTKSSSDNQEPSDQQQQRADSSSSTEAAAAVASSPPQPHRIVAHRPSSSPMAYSHTSHAMVLQLQEYRERVQTACQSTYQFPLQQQPNKPPLDGKKRKTKRGYCRSHVLETTRQCFHDRRESPAPSHFSTPIDLKAKIRPKNSDACVNFHQMTPRKDEFLFGNNVGSARRPRIRLHDGKSASGMIAKDHFALGPGQYEVAAVRPKTSSTSVKFSPSDRFHENFSTDQLGPGQYLTSDALTTPKAAVAVFSQTPRRTEAALLVSPTANTVSSYYYVPESSFLGKNASQNDNPSWPRTPRLASQRHTMVSVQAAQARLEQQQHQVDFITRNKTEVDKQTAVQRVRRARQLQGRLRVDQEEEEAGGRTDKDSLPLPSFKRRSSLFLDVSLQPQPAIRDLEVVELSLSSSLRKPSVRRASSATAAPSPSSLVTTVSKLTHESDISQRTLRSWVTLAWIASFGMQMSKIYHLLTILRKIRAMEQHHAKCVVFGAWKQLDHASSLSYAKQLIVKNTFCYRFRVRLRQKAAHASILRQFLHGLSIDVQFAIAMKKIKRKVQLIQRWWRHVQLMIRAREQALYHKWINVETRLRLDYVNQMPHLQRIFQTPTQSSNGHSANAGTSSDATLQKLLNLPDQKKWFSGRFALTSDDCLRGYSVETPDSKELLVEVKNFRCHFHHSGRSDQDDDAFASRFDSPPSGHASSHEVASSSSSLQAYHNYSNARWKPFLMVFRQGAFRFVLLTSASPMPTEILTWKERLERLVVTPSNSSNGYVGSSPSGNGGGSGSFSSDLSNGATDRRHDGSSSSVGDFVQVSMQSGVLSPSHGGSSSAAMLLSPKESFNSLTTLTAVNGSSGSFSLPPGSSSQLTATLGSSTRTPTQRGNAHTLVRSIRNRNRMGMTVVEGDLQYYVVDLLKDFPKVPPALVWQTIREKLREKRKNFRAEIYRYNLELFHFHQHQQQIKHIDVLDKFKEFFTLERPRRPHFRSLISNRTMEAIIRQTIEQLKVAAPSDPRYLLDATKPSASFSS